MSSPISSKTVFDFPVLIEELEIATEIVLQKRVSSCESRGALTIKMGDTVVWFGFLGSPCLELADCFDEVRSALTALKIHPTTADRDLAHVHSARDAIVADAVLEEQSLAAVRVAMRVCICAETVAHANYVIERSRATMRRQRETMESTENQISCCEQRIVLSRLKFLLSGQNGDALSGHTFDSTAREIRAVLDKRAVIREERRIISETEAEIARSARTLPRESLIADDDDDHHHHHRRQSFLN